MNMIAGSVNGIYCLFSEMKGRRVSRASQILGQPTPGNGISFLAERCLNLQAVLSSAAFCSIDSGVAPGPGVQVGGWQAVEEEDHQRGCYPHPKACPGRPAHSTQQEHIQHH